MKKNILLVYTALLVSMLFWGFSFVWTKIVLQAYSPMAVIFLRLTISTAFLFAMGKIFGWIKPVPRSVLKQIALLAFFEPFLYFVGENFGLVYVSATLASVIVSTIPLFTPVAAYFVLKEKMSITNIIGITFSVVGVLMVVMKSDFSFQASLKGVLLMFFAVAAAVAYTTTVAKLGASVDPITLTSYQNLLGALYFLPVLLATDLRATLLARPSLQATSALFALALFASSIAFVLFIYSLQRIGATRSNVFTNAIPVFTAVFSFFIFNENLSLINISGILIVILGLLLSQLNLVQKIRETAKKPSGQTPAYQTDRPLEPELSNIEEK